MAQTNKDAVLLTVGNRKVTVGEFESVFHKNNAKETVSDAKSVKDYLELYEVFKMKVLEAEAAGMDTIKSFRDELTGYRKQLAQPYLTDKDVNDKLLHDTYDRMKTDIRASHILVKLDENALPKDTLEAFKKLWVFALVFSKARTSTKWPRRKAFRTIHRPKIMEGTWVISLPFE